MKIAKYITATTVGMVTIAFGMMIAKLIYMLESIGLGR
jgi:hypothetical protein